VAVLAIGLFSAGIGTMVFLRTTQTTALDQNLTQLVTGDVVSVLMDIEVEDGAPTFTPKDTPSSYAVAVYGPDGRFIASAGGNPDNQPAFPATFTLEQTLTQGTEPFVLPAAEGTGTFHASVDFLTPVEGVRDNYTQMVAMSLTAVNQTVANYIGIYTILAIVTIIAGALATRAAVTLTFRGLGQVEDTAMSIASGDFSQRMGDIYPGTEVGRLKTAINAMLDRIDQALGQRDASVRQMRRFVGDASHELRTPLVTVRGYAELYRMGAISGEEQTAQSMERIEKEAIRMGALVEDLLALARLDERRDLVIADVDLRPIGRDAVMDTRATATERTVSFLDRTGGRTAPVTATVPVGRAAGSGAASGGDSSSAPTTRRRGGVAPLAGASRLLRRRPRGAGTAGEATGPVTVPITTIPASVAEPIVLGDENRIRQVVANLLANARRYTPDDSPIEVAVGVDETAGMGWVEIIDHGEGIAPQIREKIFQRFWRADTSRTRETGGSGLGLSIVASIVDALHGSIGVTETPGGGATFRVAFPLAQRRQAAEHLLIETQPLPKLRGEV